MPKVPLALTAQMEQRTNDISKDSRMVNCYKETLAGKPLLVKRPGKTQFTISPALPALGQGLWSYNSNLYAVANGVLYRIDTGTRTTVGSVSSTTNNISWVNTFPTSSPHPYMVLHDKVAGYYVDATGAFINISTGIGQVVLNTGGSGYPASGTFTVSGSGGGSGAGGTYTSTVGSITNIILTTHGSGYSGTLTVTFSGGGSSASASAAMNSFPANPVNGLVYLDGYVFAMGKDAQIWQSEQEDPTTWKSLNALTAKAEPDAGVGIAKHLNYLVAFKQWTTEFFYDNANAVGSVLSRNAPSQLEIGCASGDSIQSLEETVIWMSTPKEGGRTVSILGGLQAATISTPAIEKFLNASTLANVYSWVYKIAGHTFYGLVLTDQNVTLVYDVNEKEWHHWTTSKAFIGGGEGYFECTFVQEYPVTGNGVYVLDAVTGNVYTISPNNYVDPFGPITMRYVSPRHGFGTMATKFNGSLVVIGDQISDTLQVRHTDDDYNTWSSYRTIDLSLQKPVLYNNGKFKRRAWELLYTGTNPLRLEGLELDLTGGGE